MEIERWSGGGELLEAERRASAAVLAADLAHTLATPTSYFRELLEHVHKGGELELADLEAGREEVGKLEQLMRCLHRYSTRTPTLTKHSLARLAQRAASAARDALSSISISIEPGADPEISGDAELLTLAVLQLIRVWVEGGAHAVRLQVSAEAGYGLVKVWAHGSPPQLRSGRFVSPAELPYTVAVHLARATQCQLMLPAAGDESLRLRIPMSEPCTF